MQPSTSTTPPKARFAWRGSHPHQYECFGEPVYSMAPGVVVRTQSRSSDHRARNTWQGMLYLLTLEGVIRSFHWPLVTGNHVIIEHDDATVALYAHLRKNSITVKVGQRVATGTPLGEVGNTGNSSEPHLHVQLMDRVNPQEASGLMMTWDNITRNGEIEESLKAIVQEPAADAITKMPRSGEVFDTAP